MQVARFWPGLAPGRRLWTWFEVNTEPQWPDSSSGWRTRLWPQSRNWSEPPQPPPGKGTSPDSLFQSPTPPSIINSSVSRRTSIIRLQLHVHTLQRTCAATMEPIRQNHSEAALRPWLLNVLLNAAAWWCELVAMVTIHRAHAHLSADAFGGRQGVEMVNIGKVSQRARKNK